MIWIKAAHGPSWHEVPDFIFVGRKTVTPIDMAWLSGIIGAFVVFAAGLAYVSWEYNRWRR